MTSVDEGAAGGDDISFERDMALVFEHALALGGREEQIKTWFTSHALPGWGFTAQELVKQGRANDVLEDLARMAEGVFS